MIRHRRVMALAALVMTTAASAATALADSVAADQKGNVVNRVVRYFSQTNKSKPHKAFDFSVIGGPFYSSNTQLGVGLVAAGQYWVNRADTAAIQPSNIALKAQGSTTLFYSLALVGTNIFPDDCARINYEVKFQSMPTYYWGIGYAAAYDDANKTKFTDRELRVNAEMLWRVAPALFAGPLWNTQIVKAVDPHNPAQWQDAPLSTTTMGAGVRIQYDTRDVITAPYSGVYLTAAQTFCPRFLGNSSHAFSMTDVVAAWYKQPWRSAVVASRLHGTFTYGNTPWGLLPIFGGSTSMRGYYEGQYRDKCEMDVTVELRQHVWSRCGVALWAGAATVFPKFNDVRWRTLLPNAGVGYRWEFKHRSNVRFDVGFGRHTWGVEFSMNECF